MTRPIPYMSPAKNLGGGRGLRKMLGGVIKFQFYSRFVKISRVGQKITIK